MAQQVDLSRRVDVTRGLRDPNVEPTWLEIVISLMIHNTINDPTDKLVLHP